LQSGNYLCVFSNSRSVSTSTFSTLAPQSLDLLALEKHRSWKSLPGFVDQTPQKSRSMINYSMTGGKIIRCQSACGGWAMFRNTIRCFPICRSSAISFTEATASQKITRLSSTRDVVGRSGTKRPPCLGHP